MSYSFSRRSLRNLDGVHPDLVAVAHEAIRISDKDFMVIDGLRTIQEQRLLFKKGKSQTLKSRHLTGHAIDIVPYPVSWDFDDFYPLGNAFMQACKNVNVPLRWGGNWLVHDLREWQGSAEGLVQSYKGTFYDLPHFELSSRYY
jgi:peptidoglycan L-alanyl-D-glutamate endopeptidase CwlK